MKHRSIDADWEDSWDQIPYIRQAATLGEKYGPAMDIHDQDAADHYLEQCITHTMATSKLSREEAENVEKENIGYWAGYCDTETRYRVERLFRCAHPILGAIAETGPISPEKAFQYGLDYAKRRRNR